MVIKTTNNNEQVQKRYSLLKAFDKEYWEDEELIEKLLRRHLDYSFEFSFDYTENRILLGRALLGKSITIGSWEANRSTALHNAIKEATNSRRRFDYADYKNGRDSSGRLGYSQEQCERIVELVKDHLVNKLRPRLMKAYTSAYTEELLSEDRIKRNWGLYKYYQHPASYPKELLGQRVRELFFSSGYDFLYDDSEFIEDLLNERVSTKALFNYYKCDSSYDPELAFARRFTRMIGYDHKKELIELMKQSGELIKESYYGLGRVFKARIDFIIGFLSIKGFEELAFIQDEDFQREGIITAIDAVINEFNRLLEKTKQEELTAREKESFFGSFLKLIKFIEKNALKQEYRLLIKNEELIKNSLLEQGLTEKDASYYAKEFSRSLKPSRQECDYEGRESQLVTLLLKQRRYYGGYHLAVDTEHLLSDAIDEPLFSFKQFCHDKSFFFTKETKELSLKRLNALLELILDDEKGVEAIKALKTDLKSLPVAVELNNTGDCYAIKGIDDSFLKAFVTIIKQQKNKH